MTINYLKTRKVILSDRWRKSYKPDKAAISKITGVLPDANILGFGLDPLTGFWVLLVGSSHFTDNPNEGVILSVHINDLHGIPQNSLLLLPKK